MKTLYFLYRSGFWATLLAAALLATATLTKVDTFVAVAYFGLLVAVLYGWKFSPDARQLRTLQTKARSRS